VEVVAKQLRFDSSIRQLKHSMMGFEIEQIQVSRHVA